MKITQKIIYVFALLLFSCTNFLETNSRPDPPSITISDDTLFIRGTDADGDQLAYQIEFTDSYGYITESSWTSYFKSGVLFSMAFDIMPTEGDYLVRVRCRDEMNTISAYSNTATLISARYWHSEPLTVNSDLQSVFFSDVNNGWIVGLSGLIMHTADGGSSWQTQDSKSPSAAFKSVCFANANTGWCAGSMNTLLHTVDGGQNWESQSAGATGWEDLNDIFFVDADTGWVVSSYGNIFKTTNGGINWFSQYDASNQLTSVFFLNKNLGWAAGYWGTILRTMDGGNNWSDLTSGTNFNFYNRVYFADENRGWILETGQETGMLATDDGGTHWTFSDISNGQSLYNLSFVGNNGWAVGSSGLILNTTDGGINWHRQDSGVQGYIYDVYFIDANNGWAVGTDGLLRYKKE
jgi:photosystem II stability/assembly factor-like uncharacterized protein